METTEEAAPIGHRLKPLLMIIENALWEYEVKNIDPPGFDDEAFRAIIKLFGASVIERVWNLQESEQMSDDDRLAMGVAAANEIRKLIKVYTNIDTIKLTEETLR